MIKLKDNTEATIAVNTSQDSLDSFLNDYSTLTPKNSVIALRKNEVQTSATATNNMITANATDYQAKQDFKDDNPLKYSDLPNIAAIPQNDWTAFMAKKKAADNAFNSNMTVTAPLSGTDSSGYVRTVTSTGTTADYSVIDHIDSNTASTKKVSVHAANLPFTYQCASDLRLLSSIPSALPNDYLYIPSGMESEAFPDGEVVKIYFKDGYSLDKSILQPTRTACQLPFYNVDEDNEELVPIHFFDGSPYYSIHIQGQSAFFFTGSTYICSYAATLMEDGSAIGDSTNPERFFFQPGAAIEFVTYDDKLFIVPGQTVLEIKYVPRETATFTGSLTLRYITTTSGIRVEVEGNVQPTPSSGTATLMAINNIPTNYYNDGSAVINTWNVKAYGEGSAISANIADQRNNWGTAPSGSSLNLAFPYATVGYYVKHIKASGDFK